ncbi:MAG: CD1871A family CXXC motif-containing protein [Eggerthellaceae bacterium]
MYCFIAKGECCVERAEAPIRIGFVALGSAFMVFGMFRGEAGVVLSKAAKICLELVGIG